MSEWDNIPGDEVVGRSAWVPIERWSDKYRHRFCETNEHRGTFKRSAAVCCITFEGSQDGRPAEFWGVCDECLKGLIETGFSPEPIPPGAT